MGIHTLKRDEKWLNWAQKGAAASSDATSSGLPGLVLGLLLGAGSWVLGAGAIAGCWVLAVGCWVLAVGCWPLSTQLEGSAPAEPLSPLSRAMELLIPFGNLAPQAVPANPHRCHGCGARAVPLPRPSPACLCTQLLSTDRAGCAHILCLLLLLLLPVLRMLRCFLPCAKGS